MYFVDIIINVSEYIPTCSYPRSENEETIELIEYYLGNVSKGGFPRLESRVS